MHVSDEDLRRSIAGELFGDAPPYRRGKPAGIEDHLKRVVADLARSRLLEVEAVFNHYGSGYASYVDVFCYKRGGGSTTERNGVREIHGLTVYLSRLGPVAAVGPGEKTRHATGGSSGYLEADRVGESPPGDWSEEAREVTTKLVASYHFRLPSREQLRRPLPFAARVPTILGDPPYTVFDALFYWED